MFSTKKTLGLWIVLCLCLQISTPLQATLTLTGMLEAYSSVPFTSGVQPGFIYSYEPNSGYPINEAVIDLSYSVSNLRGEIGLQAGRYADLNYAAEPLWLHSLYNGYFGVHVLSDLWVDAGVFGSHIGPESAMGYQQWNLTRSLIADNSPYFETGIKATYSPSSPWTLTGLVLNGWQNISETNANKALGTQIQYCNEKWLVNSSTFIGNEKPDTQKPQTRLFHDFYASYKVSDTLSVMGVLDTGWERNTEDTGWNMWTGVAVMSQLQLNEPFKLGTRIENYKDSHNVIISGTKPANIWGFSANLDWQLSAPWVFRTELKYLTATEAILGNNQSSSVILTVASTYAFNVNVDDLYQPK